MCLYVCALIYFNNFNKTLIVFIFHIIFPGIFVYSENRDRDSSMKTSKKSGKFRNIGDRDLFFLRLGICFPQNFLSFEMFIPRTFAKSPRFWSFVVFFIFLRIGIVFHTMGYPDKRPILFSIEKFLQSIKLSAFLLFMSS